MEMIPLFFTGPTALIAVVWTVAVTQPDVIADHWLPLLVLLAAQITMDWLPIVIYIEQDDVPDIPTSGSLSEIALWGAILLYGPTVLWLGVIAQIVIGLRTVWQQRQLGRNLFWLALSGITQGVGNQIFTSAVALVVYEAAGGAYPLSGLDVRDIAPAALAAVVALVLNVLLLYPLIRYINHFQAGATPGSMRRWWLLVGALSICVTPFGILAALLYTEASPGIFFFYMGGVVLVDFLAYRLSIANTRSRQRAREMTELEALGEAIIKAPPDGTLLPDILTAHVTRMFPNVQYEIRLFDRPGAVQTLGVAPFAVLSSPGRLPVDPSVWERLCQSGESFTLERDVILPGTHSVYGHAIVVRITAGGPDDGSPQCVGGIYLLRPKGSRLLDPLAAVQALASQIGSALYRVQAHREALTRQRMAQELDVAGRIQTTFMPDHLPDFAGWTLAGGLVSARETSGDFFDFIDLGTGRLGLVVADVSDKGTGAALYMALSRTLIRTFALYYPESPAQALCAANERLLSDARSDQFVTVFYGVIEADGTLTYANAGHNPAYVLESGGGTGPRTLQRTGIPLGLFPDRTWTEHTTRLAPGETLVMYSDGVTEAQNLSGEEFGSERLLEAVQAHSDSVRQGYQAVMNAIRLFAGDAPQFDDITLLLAAKQ
jgi:serine phosphatase RsbU (regulator of sigma subunit)